MERERRDIFFTLRLAYVELAVEAASSLVLFYDPVALAATLETQSVRRWLAELGYPETGAAEASFLSSHSHKNKNHREDGSY